MTALDYAIVWKHESVAKLLASTAATKVRRIDRCFAATGSCNFAELLYFHSTCPLQPASTAEPAGRGLSDTLHADGPRNRFYHGFYGH